MYTVLGSCYEFLYENIRIGVALSKAND